MKVGLGGGATTKLASSPDPLALVVDGASVYWTEYNAGTVMKVAVGGGTPTVVASGQLGPNGLTADATSLYWTDDLGGMVMKLAK
jgi:hypothetical protein